MRKLFLILLLSLLAVPAFCTVADAAAADGATAAIAVVRFVDASRPDDSGDALVALTP